MPELKSLKYKDLIVFIFGLLLLYFIRDIGGDFEGIKTEIASTRKSIETLNVTMGKVVTEQSNMKKNDETLDGRIKILESIHRR